MDWSLSLDSARERLKEAWDEGKKSLEETATALTRLAGEAAHSVADVEQHALDAAGALADKSAERADAPLVKAAFERTKEGAATVADHYRHGGVARLAEDARDVVTLANQGASDALQPLVATAREAIAARQAVLDGDMHGAIVHGAKVASVAGHIGAPVEVAAFDAYRKAEKDGQSAPTVAALKATGEEMLSQANGLNPIYNGGVAGVEAHDAANKLLLERNPRAFFEHMARGSTFFASAIAGVVGLDEAAAGTEALTNAARTTATELESASLTTVETLGTTRAESGAADLGGVISGTDPLAAGTEHVPPLGSQGATPPRDTLVDTIEPRSPVEADDLAISPSGRADALSTVDPAQAERLNAAYSKLIHELRVVNPGVENDPLRQMNCVNCGVAGIATMKGSPAMAVPSTPVPAGKLAEIYDTRMERMPSLQAIETKVRASGDGALGLIFVDPHDPEELGHIVQAANREGFVLFADSQYDVRARFPSNADLWLLMVP